MARDLRAYLWDIKEASKDIELFTTGKTVENYRSDPMLRAAVERKLEIIGEALAQGIRHFPKLANQISHNAKIIAFRNRLIHGYATVSDGLVWEVVQNDLPVLRREAEMLLQEADRQNQPNKD